MSSVLPETSKKKQSLDSNRNQFLPNALNGLFKLGRHRPPSGAWLTGSPDLLTTNGRAACAPLGVFGRRKYLLESGPILVRLAGGPELALHPVLAGPGR